MSQSERTLRVLVTGDYCPHLTSEKLCLDGRFDVLYSDMLPTLHDKDLSITNLECPLTASAEAPPKVGPSLKAHPKCAEGIRFGGFDVVTLANNHVMDYGYKGLRDTIAALNAAGVKSVGAGSEIESASAPLVVERNGSSVAIVNMCESEFGTAADGRPGANPLDPMRAFYKVREGLRSAETVLVILHGGHEDYPYPSPRLIRTCRYMADIGAAAVFVHHSHCAGGVENWHNVPIFYGMGDFLFEWPRFGTGRRESFVVRLTLVGGKARSATVIPYYQESEGAGICAMPDQEKRPFMERMEQLNETLKNAHLVSARFDALVDKRGEDSLAALMMLGRFGRAMLRSKLFAKAARSRTTALLRLLNTIRCESHRDIAIASIERFLAKGK